MQHAAVAVVVVDRVVQHAAVIPQRERTRRPAEAAGVLGAALVVGFLVKFMAMGGVAFLASVVASQPFWIAGAAPTYDQWVELAALLVIACMPLGGWSGLDYFLRSCCSWRRGRTTTEVRG